MEAFLVQFPGYGSQKEDDCGTCTFGSTSLKLGSTQNYVQYFSLEVTAVQFQCLSPILGNAICSVSIKIFTLRLIQSNSVIIEPGSQQN